MDNLPQHPSGVFLLRHLVEFYSGVDRLSPKTLERYRELINGQIVPYLGALQLQKLRPSHIQDWHAKLLISGRRDGGPLSARTAGHAHRVLHRALQLAVETETLSRNVASVIKPPKVEYREIQSLTAEQMVDVLNKLDGHRLCDVVTLALTTGLRRGELLALRWSDVDLDSATLRVERSLEDTKAGLRLKVPKTRHGRRVVSLPIDASDMLRIRRRQQLEKRLAHGLGRPSEDALMFSKVDGSPYSPDNLSWDWRTATRQLGLPRVTFHALRHSHASALIASGLDVVTVSRRLGHASPAITLTTYAHLFQKTDEAAARAIDAVLRTGAEY